jgi:hypothetical protein
VSVETLLCAIFLLLVHELCVETSPTQTCDALSIKPHHLPLLAKKKHPSREPVEARLQEKSSVEALTSNCREAASYLTEGSKKSSGTAGRARSAAQ